VEIVLLVAILAIGGSALYVAFTFKNHVTRNLEVLARKADLEPLARKADLAPVVKEAAADLSGQATAVGENVRRQLLAAAEGMRDELNDKLEQLARQLSELGTSLAWQRELITGIESRVTGQEAPRVGPRETSVLEPPLLEAEAYVARGGWGQPPQLFALARKSSLVIGDRALEATFEDVAPDEIILVLQDDLPAKEPFEAIGRIRWPEGVAGCVLVTEFVAPPPEAADAMPADPAGMDRWARELPGGKAARLAVGVDKDGGYLCGLRLKGQDHVQVGGDLADELVAALLGTF
jgi:hypothetical protein